MARKHIKLGYSTSDIVDYSLWAIRSGRTSSLRTVIMQLESAAFYRREAQTPAFSVGITQRTPDLCKIWAREALRKAREWREASRAAQAAADSFASHEASVSAWDAIEQDPTGAWACASAVLR